MKTALLLIDIQREYFEGGSMPLPGALAAAARASTMRAYFRHSRRPAVFVQHIAANPEAVSFRAGTPGVCLYSTMRPLPGEAVVRKHHPNSFRDTNLLDLLRSYHVTRLAICGMMTHMCVDTTVRAAADFGFGCIVAADACAAQDLTFGEMFVPAPTVPAAFMAALDRSFASVRTTDEILAELEDEQA